jgi:hypothetical protein
MAGIIRNQLQILDKELYTRFLVIEQKAKALLEYSQGGSHLFFTTHGYSHISRVEENYDWLISLDDLSTFNKAELFSLLVATYFHDAFMIPKMPGDEPRARTEHGLHAPKFLLEQADKLDLNVHEANCIGEIIKGHAVKTLDEIAPETVLGSVIVDQRKLAACLSIADICHADASRAPRIVANYLALDSDSHWHWRRHLQIGGVARKNDKILVSATVFSDDGEKVIRAYCDDIRAQLAAVTPHFHSKLLPIADVQLLLNKTASPVERALSFKADMSELLDLLINNVYSDHRVFLRELVQNSIDACRIRAARQSDAYLPKILCTSLLDPHTGRLWGVRVDDNGAGMSINDLEDTLLWLGRSISSKAEIQKLLSSRHEISPLIGVFGIGIMSCFGVAEKITIVSAKERAQAFEVDRERI